MSELQVMRLLFSLAVVALSAAQGVSVGREPVLWAWERPEDMRFANGKAEVAVQAGFVVLTGRGVFARGRRFPVRLIGRPSVATVHVQIDHHEPLIWDAQQRRQAVGAILQLARSAKASELQIDFEVRKSERHVLLDALSDLRHALQPGEELSMTALASWCETERWLDNAPVDEIVPMLFRMGPEGQALRVKLENGGDFADPHCRSALAISLDAPLTRRPSGRRVYVFNPRSWAASDYPLVQRRLQQ